MSWFNIESNKYLRFLGFQIVEEIQAIQEGLYMEIV